MISAANSESLTFAAIWFGGIVIFAWAALRTIRD
jgi:hypothetical protein